MGDNSKIKWSQSSETQWGIRHATNTSTILMRRYCDSEGLDHDGNEVPWTDVASIYSINDADQILRSLRKGDS